MRSFMAHHGAYIDTVDDKGHRHHYRMTPPEAVSQSWMGETVTNMRSVGFPLSSIISDDSARNLWKAVH